jgi:MFS superfamily sulfate permease-like transporter
LLITVISIALLLLWEMVLIKKHKIFKVLQGPLVVIVIGILFSYLCQAGIIPMQLKNDQLVQLPVTSSLAEFMRQFSLPDFSALGNYEVYLVAATIALVASLETLLCVEATDKLDPEKRVTPTNRELKAQGLGNMVSGLVGGLPLTQVIVRSTANVSFGGKTKLSTIIHGILLLVCAFLMPALLNRIPLASLACILIAVGYKLAKPAVFKEIYKLGNSQFIPFIATVAGVVMTDLLKGIAIGMAFAIFYILRNNYKNPFYLIENNHVNGKALEYNIVLSEEVSFLNKASFLQMLNHIPENAKVVIDGTKSKVIDYDILDIVNNFRTHAQTKNILLQVVGVNQEKIS